MVSMQRFTVVPQRMTFPPRRLTSSEALGAHNNRYRFSTCAFIWHAIERSFQVDIPCGKRGHEMHDTRRSAPVGRGLGTILYGRALGTIWLPRRRGMAVAFYSS